MGKNGPQTIYHMDGHLASPNLLETDLTVESLAGSPKAAVGLGENISQMNIDTKHEKFLNKIGTKAKFQDEIQDVSQTKMDTGSTENLAEKNVNRKRRRRRKKKKTKNKVDTRSMYQDDGISNLHLSDGNHVEGIVGKHTEMACTSQEFEIPVRIGTEAKLQDEIQDVSQTTMDTGSTENLAEKNVNGKRKRRLKKKKRKIKVDTRSMCQDDGISNLHLSDGNHGEGIVGKHDKERLTPCETQISTDLNQVAAVNPKPENWLNEANDEIVVYTGRSSAESGIVFSACDIKVTQNPSFDVNKAECLSKDIGQYPRIPLNPSMKRKLKRKLIVLDINGLLADIIMPAPKDYKEDVRLLGRAIFKRPFCDDFLKFCFRNFDVGVWSSRNKKIIDKVVEYLLGDLKKKLLFCWDMSHCTQSGFRTVENIHKPLVFKELRKIWENDDPNLPWKNGDYNETNTLLLDDSPYKALLNPVHTAIFPYSYDFKDENDNSLAPGGDIRVYLEGLLTSENFQSYVQQHPFGQSAINETNLSWDFYSTVLQNMSNQQHIHFPA